VSLTKAMGCAREKPVKRRSTDLYETPGECTHALWLAEAPRLLDIPDGKIWEPAAGSGKIRAVLTDLGFDVLCSDIKDWGCPGVVLRNFLDFDAPLTGAIITNPPYGSRAPERFVRHALRLKVRYIALFLKANYFNAKERLQLHRDWPVTRTYPLTWRPDFTGDGSPTMDMTWYVWDADRESAAPIPLPRPDIGQARARYRRKPSAGDLPLFAEPAAE